MQSHKTRWLLSGTALVAMMAASAAVAQDVCPADPAALAEAAEQEGTVTVVTSTDLELAQSLLDGFTEKYGVEVAYNDQGTTGSYNLVISEAAAGQTTSDVVWSSAMDLQMTLAQDGYAAEYVSPEAANLPEWANFNNMIYGTTVEPVGAIYNTGVISADELPDTYAGMTAYLRDNAAELQGRVATFDPEKSGSGFLHHSNDVSERGEEFWELARAMGELDAKVYSSSGNMRETVVSGENAIAINAIGSYAIQWVEESPNLGVHFAADYTPAFSRLALIVNDAPHPCAARLFVDYALSQEGQTKLAEAGLPSVRTDVTAGLNIETLNERVGGGLQPIGLDEDLLAFMDPTARVQFLNDWKAALGR
jgi:iron(III) transport system substrate-binding protein